MMLNDSVSLSNLPWRKIQQLSSIFNSDITIIDYVVSKYMQGIKFNHIFHNSFINNYTLIIAISDTTQIIFIMSNCNKQININLLD